MQGTHSCSPVVVWNIKTPQFQDGAAFDHPPGCRPLGRSELILTVLTVWHQWSCQDVECCIAKVVFCFSCNWVSVWSKERGTSRSMCVLLWTFDHCTRTFSSRSAVARQEVARSTIDLFEEKTLFGCTQGRQHHRCQLWIKLRGLWHAHFGCSSSVDCCFVVRSCDGFVLLVLDDPGCGPFYFHLSVNLQKMFLILYDFLISTGNNLITLSTELLIVKWPGGSALAHGVVLCIIKQRMAEILILSHVMLKVLFLFLICVFPWSVMMFRQRLSINQIQSCLDFLFFCLMWGLKKKHKKWKMNQYIDPSKCLSIHS